MSAGEGELAGSGFEPSDSVEVLGLGGPILSELRDAGGRWLWEPVPRVILPADWSPPADMVLLLIDTGVADDHPTLAGRVVEHIDTTGEGSEDAHGHGTAVAAILAVNFPRVPIVSIKALGADGTATVSRLNHAIRVAERFILDHGSSASINISAGRRTPSCSGNCPLCVTVKDVWDSSRIPVVAAAGNSPGVAYCPARSAFSVTTFEPWAADGEIRFPTPAWRALSER